MEHTEKLKKLGFRPTFGGKFLMEEEDLQIIFDQGELIGIRNFEQVQKIVNLYETQQNQRTSSKNRGYRKNQTSSIRIDGLKN